MLRLVLSPEEQTLVEQTRRTRPHLAERCRYVLLNAQGWSVSAFGVVVCIPYLL